MDDRTRSHLAKTADEFNSIVNNWIKIVSRYYNNDKDIRYVRDNIESLFHIDQFRVIEEASKFILMYGNEIQQSTIDNNVLLNIDYSSFVQNNKNPNQIAKIVEMIKGIWPQFKKKEKKMVLDQIKESLGLCAKYTFIINNKCLPPV